ncbi:MAG: ribokinase [Geminicoccaceae bacterium]|nr:ribokinase [Geminicoccaceae bacterium]MCX8102021.1 ribokinase [Geminicoccaceae bacterium]MDW8369903.1 ribokinase [Geminicoccaceae bacterium]
MLVVLGSINADLLFRVARLPRPGETVLCPSWSFAHGGKGANQAAAAARMGARVRFAGRVGADAWGPILRQGLEEAGVDTSLLADSAKPSGTAVIAVEDSGENAILVASGANLEVDAEQLAGVAFGPGTTLLCQNEIPLAQTLAALARARAAGARTIWNLAPAVAVSADALDPVDVLIVNRGEAAALLGHEAEPEATARALAGPARTCVLTLGREGAIAVGPEGGWRVPALPVVPVDTTGAGDTFVGALAAGLDGGLAWPEALARASVAAAMACERLGAREGQPNAEAVAARLAALPPVRALEPAG